MDGTIGESVMILETKDTTADRDTAMATFRDLTTATYPPEIRLQAAITLLQESRR